MAPESDNERSLLERHTVERKWFCELDMASSLKWIKTSVETGSEPVTTGSWFGSF